MLSVVLGRVGTLGIGIVLARLLGPEEFGTYAIAYVALLAFLSFSELGVSLAIVRWPSSPLEIAPTVSTISLIASLFLAAIGGLVAPAYAQAMGDSDATSLVRILSLTIIVSGIVQTPAALMQRAFMQRKRMLIDQVGVWVGALVSVGLAFLGTGAISLGVGRLAGVSISAVLFLRYSPQPYRLGWHRQRARALLRFGLPLAGASLLVFVVGFADQAIVGHLLGPTALGFYVLAFNLSSWPVSLFSLPMRSVAPAAFARLQDSPTRMRTALETAWRFLSSLSLPICVCMAAAAGPLVQVIYGSEWGPAADVLVWLAIVAATRMFHELAYDFLVVLGSTRGVLWAQGLWLLTVVPLMLLCAQHWGIAGVAAAQLVVSVAVVVPAYLVQLGNHGVSCSALLRACGPALVVSVALGAAVIGVIRVLPSPWSSLLATVCLGLVAVAILVYPQRKLVRHLRRAPRTMSDNELASQA
jgi:PST family polysaccharide transporter